jgi:hypothetical protein
LKRAFALALLLSCSLAAAQSSPAVSSPGRLYLYGGTLLGSTRMTALGGAYVGVAEGMAGFTSNLASLAQRAPELDRRWDVGFTLSVLDIPFIQTETRDLDNDGEADNASINRHYLAGLLLQYGRFGMGWYLRSTRVYACRPLSPGSACEPIDLVLDTWALAGALALGRDDFILGMGFYSVRAELGYAAERRAFSGLAVEVDVLYRPHGLNYRVGVSVKPQLVAQLTDPALGTQLGGRALFDAAVAPGIVSLGASMRLGEGSHRYNRLSPATRRDIAERFGPSWVPPADPGPSGSWLVTGQVDLISATESTVQLQSFLGQAPVDVGRMTYLLVRAGVEHETWPDRLRTRLGTFIEPSAFPDQLPRPHLTGGIELFLFEYWEKWAFSASFDLASRYHNFGLSIGLWR